MKFIIRIFNIIIMALSAAATAFLFVPPALSFNSLIALDVEAFSKFVPETEFTKDIDIVQLLGADTINFSLKFDLDVTEIKDVMNGDRTAINNKVISKNVGEIVNTLHEPVDLITDFSIRSVIKSIITTQVTEQVENGLRTYEEKSGTSSPSTAEDIMEDVGINDEYFTSFAFNLYDAANADDATVDSVSDVLNFQVEEAMGKAADSGMVDYSEYGDSVKSQIKDSMIGVLTDLKLVKDDGHLRKISHISYIYLASYLKEGLNGSVPAEQLEQKTDENDVQYSDRLLDLFILNKIPDAFYKFVGYISLALFIGLFVFAGIWVLLIVITLFRTFTKKPWTVFGPWFWIIGFLQLILGFGITILGKFILPTYDVTQYGIPLSKVILAPRTYALVPSILYIVTFAVAIVYAVFKSIAKDKEDLKK